MLALAGSTLVVPWRKPTTGWLAEAGRRGESGRKAPEIRLTDEERSEFERVARASTSPQRDAERARIILLAAEGKENRQIAKLVGLSENAVGKWRKRFKGYGPVGLLDAPRSGRPSPFTAEQKTMVLQKAIETPRENGIPITHWSSSVLAQLAKDAGIARSIHPTTVGRWLNEADLQPHRSRYWLKNTDPDFEPLMKDVTGLYVQALELEKQGIPVFCFDEKTCIQALERTVPDIAMKAGKPHRRDQRYKRHGTTSLLGFFRVGTGKVWGTFAQKRPATVVAALIKQVCDSVPNAPKVHFVMDQLSTHWHLEVCKVVAQLSGVPFEPKQLRTGKQRKAFLADPNKRIVIHFTPRRASWLDQIEIWFSTLGRKVLHRGSFTSIADLQTKIFELINYYNRYLARPYRWTYTGTPCRK